MIWFALLIGILSIAALIGCPPRSAEIRQAVTAVSRGVLSWL